MADHQAGLAPAFNIYQVATNEFYRLYDDLISVVAGGLRDLGFECAVTKNGYQPGAVNILIGSTIFAARYHQLPQQLQGVPYIVYQLEQLDDEHGLLNQWPEYWALLQNATAILDYAPASTQYLKSKGLQNVYYLPPAYHRNIEQFTPAAHQDIDVLFYGSPHPRRSHIIEQLEQHGVNVVYLPATFGAERNEFIRRAKIVLNIHAWDDLNVLETVRLSYLLANQCLVVSETGDHNPYGEGVIFAPYAQLVETCMQYLQASPAVRSNIAQKGYAAIRAQIVEASIQQILAAVQQGVPYPADTKTITSTSHTQTNILKKNTNATLSKANLQQAFLQAQSLEATGSLAAAESLYREIIAHDPRFHLAFHALGLLAVNAGNMRLAADLLKAAATLDKRNALYQRNYGEVCRRLGHLDDAISAGKIACKLSPADIDAHYNLGLAYTDAKNFARAIKCYRNALKLNPQHGQSWNNLGSALEQQADKAGALDAYNQAILINARHAEAQNNAGAIYSELGRLDEARAHFQAAIEAKPDFVEAHYNLSSLKTYQKDDANLRMLESLYANRASLSTHARIRYCFALGKALDDIGDYNRAFAAYAEGNLAQHALQPVDEQQADAMLERIINVFNHDFFEARKNWQGSEKSPIFIVGMPRSGTTLLEQILSSHPSVYGAGELVDLSAVIAQLTGAHAGYAFTEGAAGLSSADMQHLGDEYAKRVWALSPRSEFITDKMPANFFYLGLIHLAFPNAKIIHAMRDPMDSCFSCYARLFNDSMEFAYDQETLGRYYVRYIKLMQHWHRVLPKDRILDLRYEDMVADTEHEARRVLEFIGLPWDANCLNFHQNTRLVKTASVAQVRKPIYNTSVARWKHFAQHLRPLYALVKNYREAAAADEILPAGLAMSAEEYHLQGIELYRQGRFEDALVCYDQALSIQPDYAAALNSRGFLLQDTGHMQDALACFERATELAPEFSMARLNLGMAQLKLGNWEQGWDNYEARWTGSAEAHGGSLQRPLSTLPQWDGQADTSEQDLLVITEQGFGDTFQFARYLILASQRFAKVGFVCSLPTLRLMEWALGDKVVLLNRMPADNATWHWHCPLMSLPRAFKTRTDNIPDLIPYLKVPAVAQQHWLARLNDVAPGRFRVGIAWAGRKAHQYDSRRSLSFKQVLPLFNDARITWVSLQKWAADEARPDIPADIDWLDWTEELTDFADTAALVANLDLIISIDSSMVHLAGGLGRPVWMMDRFDNEWRWLAGRDDSPWYANLRIFRQQVFGDWDCVILRIQEALLGLPMPEQPRKKRQVLPLLPSTHEATATKLPAAKAIQLAGQYQSAGRLQEAEHILRRILESNPKHAHAIHLLGVIAYQAGKPSLALELIKQAMTIAPEVALFNSNFAEMSRQQGALADAIHYGQRAVALDPSMASAHSNLGVALYDDKQYEQAESCHHKALQLMPEMIQSINNMGSIQHARNNLKEAARWYRRALDVNPNYLESLSNLGVVLVEDQQADGAVPYLERALVLQPDYAEALCYLGLARLQQQQPASAAVLLERALQQKPAYVDAMLGLAQALHMLNRNDECLQLLQLSTIKAPQNAAAWRQLANFHREQGNSDLAEQAFSKAQEFDERQQ